MNNCNTRTRFSIFRIFPWWFSLLFFFFCISLSSAYHYDNHHHCSSFTLSVSLVFLLYLTLILSHSFFFRYPLFSLFFLPNRARVWNERKRERRKVTGLTPASRSLRRHLTKKHADELLFNASSSCLAVKAAFGIRCRRRCAAPRSSPAVLRSPQVVVRV